MFIQLMDANFLLYPMNKMFSIKRQVRNTSLLSSIEKAFQIFQACLATEHTYILSAEE